MERPPHIIFDRHQPFSRRACLFAVAICLQLAGFWLFTQGLNRHVQNFLHSINFVALHEKEVPPVKPPEPVLKKAQIPIVQVPDFKIEAPTNSKNALTSELPTQNQTTGTTNVQRGPTQAAVGIISTHTVPPYPPIARRMGAQGKVTLRLTVSPQGRVVLADIVTTSGRDELDQAAQQWIVAHWTYKPALENGVAVGSRVLVTVNFNLSSQP